MFVEIVIIVFKGFVEKYKFYFLKDDLIDNQVILQSIDFDIKISYDEREDNIYIDFDMKRFMEAKKYPSQPQFPLYLSLDAISSHLEIQSGIFFDDKTNILKERIKVKFELLQIVWNELIKKNNYKVVLSDILIEERIILKNINESHELKTIISKACHNFKLNNFEQVVLLLNPHKEKLNRYEKKILEYSIEKMR